MKLPNQVAHLSEEALDAILIGATSAGDEDHLAVCESCSIRLAEFRSTLGTFNQASAAWSQARSNTISRELTPRKASHTTAAAWSLASVAVLAVAVSLSGHIHRSADPGPLQEPRESSSGQQPNRQQEIANDNAMLVAIDSELSQPVQSPVVEPGKGGVATRQAVRGEVLD